MSEAAGFWSYVHSDDEADDGRISLLAEKVANEYRVITGDTLDLFSDRQLVWGDEWNQRIDDAIAGTTFFIPIITPSYFRSEACRAELLRFSSKATRLGLEELILSVYWVPVRELDSTEGADSDEAIALIRKFQWADFRDVRLKDLDSSEFRTAVNRLATDLARRGEAASGVQDTPPSPPPPKVKSGSMSPARADLNLDSSQDDDEPGLLEVVVDGEEAMNDVTRILAELGEEIEQVGVVANAASTRFEELPPSSNLKARLVLTQRTAQELTPAAERIEALGQQFAARLVPADAGIVAAIEALIEADPPDPEQNKVVLETTETLASSAGPAIDSLRDMLSSMEGVSRLSRSMRPPLAKMRRGLQGVIDGKIVIDGWAERARQLPTSRGDDDLPTPISR